MCFCVQRGFRDDMFHLVYLVQVWHFSIYGLLHSEKKLHPLVADLLDQDESAYYSKSRKGRNLVTLRLQQLISGAELSQTQVRTEDQPLCHCMADVALQSVSLQGYCSVAAQSRQ